MEVSKENLIFLAEFDDLPNEIMWRIFRYLCHTDLLQMSLVCRRWNQVIFHFLKGRFLFCPKQCDDMCEDRTYRHMDLSECPLPLPNLNEKWLGYFHANITELEFLSRHHVTSLTVRRTSSHLDLLVRLLINFSHLETLVWNVPGKMLSYYKVPKFKQRLLDMRLARVRHLAVHVKSGKMMELLEKLSNDLVSLTVVVSHEKLFALCESPGDFSNLEFLKLIVDDKGLLHLESILKEFLQKLPKLRKFAFKTADEEAIQEVTEAKTNIEEFELIGLTNLSFPLMQHMGSLRTFRSDGMSFHFWQNAKPMPQITMLDIDQATDVEMEALVVQFPNLTTLRMKSRVNSPYDMLRLVVHYPALKVLSFRVVQGFDLTLTLTLMARILQDLCELSINLTVPDESEIELVPKLNFSVFGIVLEAQTLRKLHISTGDEVPIVQVQDELPNTNPKCEVFVNDVLVERQ